MVDIPLDVCYYDLDDILAIKANNVNNNFIMEVQNLRTQKNEEVRQLAKERDVKLWEIAERLGCADATLSRKLRRELPEAEKKAILDIIEAISAEQGE